MGRPKRNSEPRLKAAVGANPAVLKPLARIEPESCSARELGYWLVGANEPLSTVLGREYRHTAEHYIYDLPVPHDLDPAHDRVHAAIWALHVSQSYLVFGQAPSPVGRVLRALIDPQPAERATLSGTGADRVVYVGSSSVIGVAVHVATIVKWTQEVFHIFARDFEFDQVIRDVSAKPPTISGPDLCRQRLSDVYFALDSVRRALEAASVLEDRTVNHRRFIVEPQHRHGVVCALLRVRDCLDQAVESLPLCGLRESRVPAPKRWMSLAANILDRISGVFGAGGCDLRRGPNTPMLVGGRLMLSRAVAIRKSVALQESLSRHASAFALAHHAAADSDKIWLPASFYTSASRKQITPLILQRARQSGLEHRRVKGSVRLFEYELRSACRHPQLAKFARVLKDAHMNGPPTKKS